MASLTLPSKNRTLVFTTTDPDTTLVITTLTAPPVRANMLCSKVVTNCSTQIQLTTPFVFQLPVVSAQQQVQLAVFRGSFTSVVVWTAAAQAPPVAAQRL